MSALKRVFLDPDGTDRPGWIYVIVEAPTGVLYINQCDGFAKIERMMEGYLVPVSGAKMNVDDGKVAPQELSRIFEQAGSFGTGIPLSAPRQKALGLAVAKIPFWTETETETYRDPLKLDWDRADAILEAWVPVITRIGRGILVWRNCG